MRPIRLAILVLCGLTAAAGAATRENGTMSPTQEQATLGYTILYVKDVPASLAFYEKAFGLSRRFLHDEDGKAYGELETGAARLAFASLPLVQDHLKGGVTIAAPDKPPLGFEVALVTPDVSHLYERALKAGAASVTAPEVKPWGQTVAYVRDGNGFLVELCTPLP
ncbi:MAG TPA: VOC family protein [Allosphingosinicella sp.]|nr:VOC family protein [Allosphingosinicella sp.]